MHSRPHKIFLHFHDLWTVLNKIREYDKMLGSLAVKPPILNDACIDVHIKYFHSFMTFGPY